MRSLPHAMSLVLMCSSCALGQSSIADIEAPTHISYTITYHPSMSDREFSDLKAQVSNRPEHPQRRAFETESKRRSQGPDQATYDAWIKDGTIYRTNNSNIDDELYYDIITDKTTTWTVSNQHLSITPLDGSGSSGAPSIAASFEETTFVLNMMLSSGRSLNEHLPIGPWEPHHSSHDTRIASSDEFRLEHTSLTGSAGPGFKVELTQAAIATDQTGLKWTFTGNTISIDPSVMSSPSDLPIYETCTEYTPAGIAERTITINTIEPIDKDTFKAIIQKPTIEGEDAIRGPYTFSTITDYRKKTPRTTTTNTTQQSTTTSNPPPTQLSFAKLLRFSGYLLVVIVIIVTGIKATRK